jgi:chitinase
VKFSRSIKLSLVGLAAIAALSGCGSKSNLTGLTEPPLDTTPPPAPANLTLSADLAGNPILVWDASAALDVASYQVEVYSGSVGDFVAVMDPNVTDTSFPIPEVATSTEESYRVRAVDTSGNTSPFSATTTIMVPAPGQPSPIDIN